MPHDHACSAQCGCGPTSGDTGLRPDVAQIPKPWRPRESLRAIAIAIFRRGDHILAGPVYDDNAQIKGWRPLGGGIAFGERAADTLSREIREETGQEICDLRQIGVLENLYQHHGQTGHELVMVFEAAFANTDVYLADQLSFKEEDGIEMHAKWVSLARARAGRVALYPEGLADLLG